MQSESGSAPTPPADARRLAWEVLIAVEGGAFADGELGRRLTRCDLERRDQALATQLVYGTLAWQGYLDHIVASCGQTPADLDVPIRTVLRLALFQLAKLSRVPDFAAVDTAVELSKTHRRGAASRMVNAVLRRFLRGGKAVPLPPADDVAAYLAVAQSHPRWLVELWLAELGREETEALLRANNEPAATALRINAQRGARAAGLEQLAAAGFAARPSPMAPQGIVLETGGDPAALPGYSDGRFSLQGEASQLVALLLGARPGMHILDVCAAPGGKAAYVAELLDGQGRVLALDSNHHGLVQLRRAARRLRLECLDIARADASRLPLADGRVFDAVLLDAPCSGLGTLRQHPEIRWRRTPAQLADLAARQARLLNAAVAHVRTGGAIVYATCTIAAIENEQIVRQFLSAHADFALDEAAPWLPPPARHLADQTGFLRTMPHRDGLDGFFAARLKRCR